MIDSKAKKVSDPKLKLVSDADDLDEDEAETDGESDEGNSVKPN